MPSKSYNDYLRATLERQRAELKLLEFGTRQYNAKKYAISETEKALKTKKKDREKCGEVYGFNLNVDLD